MKKYINNKPQFDGACLSKLDFSEEVCNKINEWIKKQKGFLTFCSHPGIGKSYLCHAIKNYLTKNDFWVALYKEMNYFNCIRSVISVHGWDYQNEVQRLCEVDFLILDDIISLQMTEWQKEVLFSTVDLRYESNKPTVITSNFSINQMSKELGDKFTSRLCQKGNTLIQIWDGIDNRTGKEYNLQNENKSNQEKLNQ
jgi:DNA replication protein DnaC